MEDKKLSAGESELEVRGLQWLDTGHYRKKPPHFGYNPHDWNELCLVADAQRQIAEHKRLLAERDAKIEALTEYAAAVERSADKAEQELDQLRALLSEQPQATRWADGANISEAPVGFKRPTVPPPAPPRWQASAAQSAHRNLLGELYQVLGALDAPDNVLDNVSAAIHDEPLPHATLLPFVVSAQSAPAGEREDEREAFEAWIKREAGEHAAKRWPNDNGPGYANDRVQDYRTGWVECLAWQRTQSTGVPEGYAIVPAEPSHAMTLAGETQWEASGNDAPCAASMYRAMLSAAPAQPAARKSAVPSLTEKEREDLLEFHEAVCCDSGHRVEKEGMRRLAEIGAVESVGFGKHRLTEFGVYLLGIAPKAAHDQGEVQRLRDQDEQGNIVLTPQAVDVLAQCVAAHSYVLGALVNGRPDLALIEAKKWVDGFRDAASTGQEVKDGH